MVSSGTIPLPLLIHLLIAPIAVHMLVRPAASALAVLDMPDLDTACDELAEAFTRAVATEPPITPITKKPPRRRTR